MQVFKKAHMIKLHTITISSLFFCFLLIFSTSSIICAAAEIPANFAGGSGTEVDPYLISNAQELAALSNRVSQKRMNDGMNYSSAHYVQTKDINLSSIDRWLPIGVDEKRAFFGVYSGGGYKISNLRYSRGVDGKNFENYGLFGVVSGDAVLRGIKIENAFPDIKDARVSTFGVIVGYIASGTVRECSSAGNGISIKIVSPSDRKLRVLWNVGGIAGRIRSGDIIDCINHVGFAISSDRSTLYVGGIIGRFENGTLENCRNKGAMDFFGPQVNVGGIAGFEWSGKSINCFNFGSVRLVVSRGATAGGIHAGSSGSIVRCVNAGNVEVYSTGRSAYAGGIVGFMHGESSIEESINVGNIMAKVKCDWEKYKKTYYDFDNTDSVPKERIESIHPEIKAGGLVAKMWGGQLRNVANKGSVSGKILAEGVPLDLHIGGLVGTIELPGHRPSYVVIQDSFNTGIIHSEGQNTKASYAVGGIVGFSNVKTERRNRVLSWIFGDSDEYVKNKISRCYWLGGAGTVRGVGKYEYQGDNPDDDTIVLTADEFKIQNTFVGWDFKDIWTMLCEDTKAPALKALQKENLF